MKTIFGLGLVVLGLAAIPGRAEVWGAWTANGTSCNANNVSALDSGSTLSVLFNEFGVNMPSGQSGDGLRTTKTCNFQISMNAPPGQYLAGFTQLFTGGVVKSAKSAGQLSIKYVVGPAGGPPQALVWNLNQAILPTDAASQFAKQLNEPLPPLFCGSGRAMFYKLNMVFDGLRNNPNEFFIGGLDSVDAGERRLVLQAAWAPCPVFTDEQKTITALYRILLKRFADPQGLAAWVPFLHKNGLAALAKAIKNSPEYKSGNHLEDPEPIAELYREILFREPDSAGLIGWVNKASNGTLSILEIEQRIRNSHEAGGLPYL